MTRARPRARRRARETAPDAETAAFQSPLEALVARPAPLVLRLWPLLGLGLVLGILALAALTRIDVVVTAQGRLTPDAPPMVLQPMGSAVLRELRVRPGDVVEKGQVVAALDATFTRADREALEAQRRAMTAQRDRLEAELAGAGPDAAPDPEGSAGGGVEAAVQALLHVQRRAFHAARLDALDAEIAALQAQAVSETALGGGIEQQLGVAVEIEGMRERLADREVGSRLSLLQSRAARLDAEQERRRHDARSEEIALRLTAAIASRDAFLRDWERQILEELARVGPELARVDEQIAKADLLDAMTELRAPAAGVVLDVARRAPGSIVREGEPVVVLVPSGAPLIAEVQLRSADIGWLTVGDETVLKIDAYPWRRFGALTGRLRSVSRDSFPAQPDGGGGAVHRGHILLDAQSLPRGPARDGEGGGALTPGMTLAAEIKVGTRSALGFFVEPLLRGLNESLREP